MDMNKIARNFQQWHYGIGIGSYPYTVLQCERYSRLVWAEDSRAYDQRTVLLNLRGDKRRPPFICIYRESNDPLKWIRRIRVVNPFFPNTLRNKRPGYMNIPANCIFYLANGLFDKVGLFYQLHDWHGFQRRNMLKMSGMYSSACGFYFLRLLRAPVQLRRTNQMEFL